MSQQNEKLSGVWVMCWPKGTTEEWRGVPHGPKDYDVVRAGVEEKFQVKLQRRVVWGDVLAVFATRKEAEAYRTQNRYDKSFIIRAATLRIVDSTKLETGTVPSKRKRAA